MEFEAMQQMWESQDKKLDALVHINARLLGKAALDKADSAMRWQFREVLFEVILNFGAVVLLGWYLADHIADMRFAIPAAALDVYVIALNIALIRQLAAIKDIDYAAPVVEIQRRLEQLAIKRIGMLKWTLLFCPLMWVPLQIVAFQVLFGVDVYAYFGRTYLVANLLFGFAVIPIAVWISRRFAHSLNRSPLLRYVANTIAGSNFKTATSHLKELARFEAAESPNSTL
jgi:hypothetical protein